MPSEAVFIENLPNSSLSSMKSAFPISSVNVALFLLSPKIVCSPISWSLWPRQPPVTISPVRPSLLTSNKSRRAPFLVDSLGICNEKYYQRHKNICLSERSQSYPWNLPLCYTGLKHRLILNVSGTPPAFVKQLNLLWAEYKWHQFWKVKVWNIMLLQYIYCTH